MGADQILSSVQVSQRMFRGEPIKNHCYRLDCMTPAKLCYINAKKKLEGD